MKTKKTMSKLVATAALAVAALTPSFAQNNLGESCGCPNVSARSTSINIGTYADVNGNLTVANLILTCDKMWVLDKKIFVGDGQTITINPGTVVKGAAGTGVNATALIISKGGKIFATGTESCPIVFTAAADPMDGTYGISNRGGWGGVIVLGKAKNNQAAAGTLSTGTAGVAFIEGFVSSEARIQFGMPVGTEVDDDNSGIMTYVSIRHGGAIVGAANEINGLTLGSVGRGTTLHHIEVVSNLDDGIEFFGGTVDLKYGSVLFNDDDGFDWDLGWSGKGQFWSIVKTDQGTSSGGDNGFESDGDDNKGGGAFQSNPTVYNATYLGSNNINGSAVQKGVGLMAKEQSQGTIRNCVIANYQVALDLKDDATRPAGVDCYDNWIAGSLKIECNTFVANTHGLRINGVNAVAGDANDLKFLADGNVIAATVPGFDFLHTMNVSTNVVSDTYDAIPNPALTSACTVAPVDGFFTAAPYRGAFAAGAKSWLANYSINALYDLENGLVACPTDINGDGVTNNIDFLQLVGAFNQSCD